MTVPRPSTLLALAVIGPLVLAPASADAGKRKRKPAPRADLVVSAGSLAVSKGKLTGTFTVANRGTASAGRFAAAVTVRVSKKARRKTVKTFTLSGLRAGRSVNVKVSVSVPPGLPAGKLPLDVCADSGAAVKERSDDNNCRSLGKLTISSTGVPVPTPTPTPSPSPTPTPTPTPSPTPTPTPGPSPSPAPDPGPAAPMSTVPAQPFAFTPDSVIGPAGTRSYWLYVPASYDSTHQTATTLFVWMHGCGGESSGDIYNVAPYDGGYIAIAPGGAEDACWDPSGSQAGVLATIADVETHFNIDRHRVILGGYSSGGDLGYRLMYDHGLQFAGLLAQNTAPFQDTGYDAATAVARAPWKFNVVQLSQTSDGTYPIAQVRSEVATLRNAGFPVTAVEKPGSHYDGNTDGYTQTVLLPHLADGWRSP